jgi:WXG100 family type VII secretion target
MAAVIVSDEYYERYRHLSHDELYRMLRAGSPGRIDAVAATWKSISDTAAKLAANLRRDLDSLALSWTGPAGRAFVDRFGQVASYAQRLADESNAIRTGLSVMSAALAEAQRQAEQPDRVVPFERAFAGVVNSTLGHEMTVEAAEQARARIVQLVADLAAEYGVVDHGTWPAAIPPAPDGPAGGVPDPAASPSPLTGTGLTAAVTDPPHSAGTVLLGLESGPLHGGAPAIDRIAIGGGTVMEGGTPVSRLGGAGTVTSGLTGVPMAGGSSGSVIGPGGGRDDGRVGGGPFAPQQPAPMLGQAVAGRPIGAHPGAGAGPDPQSQDGQFDWYANDQIAWTEKTDDAPPAVLG